MQGLLQRCDDDSQSDSYGSVLERAQYDGMMRDIIRHIQALPPTMRQEYRASHGHEHTNTLARTWHYDAGKLQLPTEVPQISIMLFDEQKSVRNSGYLLSTERLCERMRLTLGVNADSHTDTFHDEGVKEWMYGLLGERYRSHDVGRWRGYSPEAARIAQAVLNVLSAPKEKAAESAGLETKVA